MADVGAVSEFEVEELVRMALEMPAEAGDRRRHMVAQVEARLRSWRAPLDDRHLTSALRAMASVPREEFVPADFENLAYLPMSGDIGDGQTISKPDVVALMTAAARVDGESVVLEVGTGSGYHAAVLATLARRVVTCEIVPRLARTARLRLARLGYGNVEVLEGDWAALATGTGGFDAILVPAGAAEVPRPLLDLLAPGGRIVMPLGARGREELVILRNGPEGVESSSLGRASFVPLTGAFGREPA